MINKKRQELLINNLKSISAEVRQRSLQQLMQIPTISKEEKISFAESLLQDSEEEVRRYAQAIIKELGGDAPALAPDSAPFSAPAAPTAPVMPDLSSLDTPPVTPPMPAVPPASPSVPPFSPVSESPLPSTPEPVQPQTVATPVAPANPPGSGQFFGLPSQVDEPSASALPTLEPSPVQAPPALDETLDPSLPDLKKINDIPTLLQHIKTLTNTKPSGYLVQLLQMSESQLEEVALSALQALLNLKDRKVPPQILFKLANENSSSQRRFLMLKIIMDTEITLDTALLERILLNEKDVIVKSGLVKVFARNSRERGIGTIITCLQDPDPRVRANTVEVIEEQGIRGCEQQIVQLLQDPENRVKVNAAKFLVKNGYQQAFLTLRSMLVSSEVWLRDSVIFALGEIGDQASLTLLKAALKDPNQGIRLSVLKSLAKINNSMARQVLKAASGDPDAVVAQVANSLWEKIKDTPLRADVKLPTALGEAPPVAPAAPQAPIPPVAPAAPVAPPQAPIQPVAPAAPVAPPQAPIQPVAPAAPVAPPQAPVQPVAPAAPVAPPQAPVPPVAPAAPVAPPQAPIQPVAPAAPVAPPQAPVPPVAPAAPVAPPQPPVPPVAPAVQPQVSLPEGSPNFAKPRSAEVYARMISNRPEEWQIAARDMAFVMGDDQILILNVAYNHEDEHIRLSAAKILSRKRTPEARAVLEQMANDPNELVRSLVEKTLLINK